MAIAMKFGATGMVVWIRLRRCDFDAVRCARDPPSQKISSAASRLDPHCSPVVRHRLRPSPATSHSSPVVCPMSADPRIVALLASVSKQDTRLVSVVEETLGLLEAGNLAYRLRIPPKMVGTHPANRNGCGVSATEVHALGAEITSMGWHLGNTSHAVCVEDSESLEIAKFSRAQAMSSVGMLGVVEEGSIKYGSLSCSHTNAFLVAVLCEVETTHSSIAENGRLSPSKLSTDPNLADILQNGLHWLVLSKAVPALYPSFLDLVQFAKNAVGSAQRRENEIQILMKIQSMAAASPSSVDWPSISSFVAKRNQLDNSELKVYLKFVQLFGDGPFLTDLHKYFQSFVPTGRVVPISTFSAIVDLKLTPGEMAPYMAVALVKAQASCPENKVQNKVCKFISVGDITALAGPQKKNLERVRRGPSRGADFGQGVRHRFVRRPEETCQIGHHGRPLRRRQRNEIHIGGGDRAHLRRRIE